MKASPTSLRNGGLPGVLVGLLLVQVIAAGGPSETWDRLLGCCSPAGVAAWNQSGLSPAQLESIRGKDYEPECVQYFGDWEQPSLDCWSPYTPWTDNDCEWKKCTDNAADGGCGTGNRWSGLYQASWIATNQTDPDIGWRAKSSPCKGIIDCREVGQYNEELSCSPGVLFSHFLDEGARVQGRGCHAPDPGTEPTGCRECTAGMPDPFHPNNTNWIWYERVDCPFGY